MSASWLGDSRRLLLQGRHRDLRALPCAARHLSPLWPLAHIQGSSAGAIGSLRMRPIITPFSSTSSSFNWPERREAFARLRISDPNFVSALIGFLPISLNGASRKPRGSD
jgi:hypothetical protein